MMLRGDAISLRTVLPADLDVLYQHHIDVEQRGDHYPLSVDSYTAFRKNYEDDGFWADDHGMLVMIDGAGGFVGDIVYFKPGYLDAWELGYRLYDRSGSGGRGYTSEAVSLLSRYLFRSTKVDRIQLGIHPDNIASQRVAQKCGFTLEATLHRAFHVNGATQDVQIWALLRPGTV